MAPVSSEHGNALKALAPLWVALAIFLLPPLGIYLLWKHPALGQSGVWRKAAYAWCAVWCIAQVSNAFTGERKKTGGRTTHSDASSAKTNPEVPRAGQSADYRRGWEETYEIAKQSGESRRRSQSSQFGSPIESQITALRSTLRSLEGVPVELRGESWRESYDVTKGRLDGLTAGLKE
jgi:hypothetical protein